MEIRNYYLEKFPHDELGLEINENATWVGLLKTLNTNGQVYDYLGVGDSLIRENCFAQLANLIGVNYNEIYYKWLNIDL
jgi:hypothetical protein